MKTQNDFKNDILCLVKEYAETFHVRKAYEIGDKINYSGRFYDSGEMMNLADSMLEFWLTGGSYTYEFEKKLADYIGVKYCSFVNSGSSANLLAFMALTSPLLKERAISPGDEVITVAAGFPTTISPIIQYGAIPVFVDISIPQYNIDVSALEKAISDKSKAIILAHTLGNPFDIATVKAFCDKHRLWLIEDNCDALGSEYTLDNKTQKTGSFGDMATSSFYPPHHITTGEGGAVYTNNELLNKIIRSMRDWGRDCACASGQDNLCGHRFDGQFGELPQGYDHKYVYSHFGYNLKATDMQAAIGVAQLDKINIFTDVRRRNFNMLKEALLQYNHKLILPEACLNSNPSWFGFLITCREGVDKNMLVQKLEESNIQTRTLFAGNIISQPCFDHLRRIDAGYRVVDSLVNTDNVMNNAFWVGVYPGISETAIHYISDVIGKSL